MAGELRADEHGGPQDEGGSGHGEAEVEQAVEDGHFSYDFLRSK